MTQVKFHFNQTRNVEFAAQISFFGQTKDWPVERLTIDFVPRYIYKQSNKGVLDISYHSSTMCNSLKLDLQLGMYYQSYF